MDFSEIKNEELRNLIQNSRKFNTLPEKDQKEYLQKLKLISKPEDIKKMRDFFANENEKEEEEQKEILRTQIRQMEELGEKVKNMAQSLKKMQLKEDEKKEENEDEEKAEELLESLNNK